MDPAAPSIHKEKQRPPVKIPSLLLSILVPFPLASCAADREHDGYGRMYEEARGPLDSELAERIWKAMLWDGILRHDVDSVNVHVVDGVVTLDGTVRREETAERLVEVVPTVPGVVTVLDLVGVDPHYGSAIVRPWRRDYADWNREPRLVSDW